MLVNPIVRHEWRTRFRTPRAMSLLGALCLPLILIACYYYDGVQRELPGWSFSGRQLFHFLSTAQTFGWLVLVPTLTATTIANERERGLLEGLQLSHLSPLQILLGKLGSALAMATLMLIATLPVIAVCFLLGGVSPADLVQTTVLNTMTAVFAATVGLTFSALTRRGTVALRATFIALFFWLVLTWVALSFANAPVSPSSAGTYFWPSLFRLFAGSNPLFATNLAEDVYGFSRFVPPATGNVVTGAAATTQSATLNWFDSVSRLPPFVLCLTFQVIAIPLMLWRSCIAVSRPFGDNTGKSLPKKSETEKAEHIVDPSMWWEIPYLGQWRSSNPVLQRETRGKFRMRKVPLWAVVFEIFLGLAVAYAYTGAMITASKDDVSKSIISWTLLFMALGILILSCISMGAANFTRERETGTFEGLMLSLVTEREMVRGKIGSILVACAVFAVPTVPLLLRCIHQAARTSFTVWQLGLALLILGATAWFYASLGSWISWRFNRSAPAVGWAMGVAIGLNVVCPLLLGALILQYHWEGLRTLLSWTSPFVAVTGFIDARSADTGNAMMCALLYFGGGLYFYLDLQRRLTRRARIV